MACDEFFRRSLQHQFDAVFVDAVFVDAVFVDAVFGPKDKAAPSDAVLAEPHRLIGTEVWLQWAGREAVFLEGVTGIEFREGKIVFQTALGETIDIAGELPRG